VEEEEVALRRRLSLNVRVCFVSLSFSMFRSSSDSLKEVKVWVVDDILKTGWLIG